jgi:hypothetical protein
MMVVSRAGGKSWSQVGNTLAAACQASHSIVLLALPYQNSMKDLREG